MKTPRAPSKTRQMFDRLVARVAPYFVRGVEIALEDLDGQTARLKTRGWQSCGVDVRVSTRARINHPRFISAGNGVSIEDDAIIEAEGGVFIGDDVQIGVGAVIEASTALPDAPQRGLPVGYRRWNSVEIGPGAVIGPRACLRPGAIVGANAVVPAGAVIDGAAPFLADAIPASLDPAAASERPTLAAPSIGSAERFPNGAAQAPDIAFVVTTGRSGSTAIADTLAKHPTIDARHEPRPQMIAWSTEYARGALSRDAMADRLRRVFLDYSVYKPGIVRVESDQKYFNVIDILAEIFPKAKFLFLTRNGYDVVSSTYGRGWYRDGDSLPRENDHWFWNYYQVFGTDGGTISKEDWASMSPFERNCWYWAHVNATISGHLAKLPNDRSMHVRLEAVDQTLDAIQDFLGVDRHPIASARSNVAAYKTHASAQWSETERAAFERMCGPLMAELYDDASVEAAQ